MADQTKVQEADQRRDELLRRALATPPISNEEILRRSSQREGRLRRSPNKARDGE